MAIVSRMACPCRLDAWRFGSPSTNFCPMASWETLCALTPRHRINPGTGSWAPPRAGTCQQCYGVHTASASTMARYPRSSESSRI